MSTHPPYPGLAVLDQTIALVARDVLQDYGRACDSHATCACSMARLARLLEARFSAGPEG